MLLTDLAQAARKSGLRVVELKGWAGNVSGGEFNPRGVLCHHTGSHDAIADTDDDLTYAHWLAFTGRPDLPAPLCNLALSAEGVVYVCSSGNANHAGEAQASGPLPRAGDGNALYIGIEAMNSGSQGWDSKGADASGRTITQRDAYARLCAALCDHYGWPASHVRGHRETSLTGKWDPGLLDMDRFRSTITDHLEDDMADYAKQLDRIEGKVDAIDDVLRAKLTRANTYARQLLKQGKATKAELEELSTLLSDDA